MDIVKKNLVAEEREEKTMKIRSYCSLSFAEKSIDINIPDEELKGLNEEEKEYYIYNEYVIPFAEENVDKWYEEIKE